jgi:hypothetical protein
MNNRLQKNGRQGSERFGLFPNRCLCGRDTRTTMTPGALGWRQTAQSYSVVAVVWQRDAAPAVVDPVPDARAGHAG